MKIIKVLAIIIGFIGICSFNDSFYIKKFPELILVNEEPSAMDSYGAALCIGSGRDDESLYIVDGMPVRAKLKKFKKKRNRRKKKQIKKPIKILSPHEGALIDVYVSKNGLDKLKKKKNPNFDLNTVLLKKKYKTMNVGGISMQYVELYTAMRKIKFTENPKLSNWKFEVLDKDLNIVPQTSTQNCKSCHAKYKSSDFVTRDNYINTETKHNWK